MYILWSKGPVTVYRRGRGGGDFRGSHLILGEKMGGSVVIENPKGGIAENFGRIQTVGHSNLLGKWRHVCVHVCVCVCVGGGGENRESHQKLLGGSLQWSNKRGDRLNFTLSSPQILPPLLINNDRSLIEILLSRAFQNRGEFSTQWHSPVFAEILGTSIEAQQAWLL